MQAVSDLYIKKDDSIHGKRTERRRTRKQKKNLGLSTLRFQLSRSNLLSSLSFADFKLTDRFILSLGQCLRLNLIRSSSCPAPFQQGRFLSQTPTNALDRSFLLHCSRSIDGRRFHDTSTGIAQRLLSRSLNLALLLRFLPFILHANLHILEGFREGRFWDVAYLSWLSFRRDGRDAEEGSNDRLLQEQRLEERDRVVGDPIQKESLRRSRRKIDDQRHTWYTVSN